MSKSLGSDLGPCEISWDWNFFDSTHKEDSKEMCRGCRRKIRLIEKKANKGDK